MDVGVFKRSNESKFVIMPCWLVIVKIAPSQSVVYVIFKRKKQNAYVTKYASMHRILLKMKKKYFKLYNHTHLQYLFSATHN